MRRLSHPALAFLLAFAWLFVLAMALGAQAPTARDSLFAVKARTDLDSLARDKSAPAYSKRAQTRLRARVDSLVRGVAVVPVPAAPVASFAGSCALLGCSYNASASTGTRLTYAWRLGVSADGVTEATTTGPTASYQYPHGGSVTVGLTVRDSLGRVAATTRTFTVPGVPVDTVAPAPLPPPVVVVTDTAVTPLAAELPRATPAFTIPAPLRITRLAAGGDLQAALSAAQPGDELRLASGATWTGNYTLPSRPCSAVTTWITVRTDIADSELPPAGTRITPTYAPKLAKIATTNTEAALRTTGPLCGWRLLGLEIVGTSPVTVLNYGILKLGDGGWVGGGDTQTSLDRVPQDVVLDRVYLHGLPTTNTARCLALNSGRTAVINSWLAECHAKGFDSQAIEGWNGPGPYLIENNFIAGAGENIMFGGADPGITGLSPSDITIRRNHVYKDPAWRGVWTVKNLFELKNARRVLVESNVFENNWADAQSGMAIVIKSTTDSCGTGCMWEGTTDVTFRYNIVRNSPRGINVQAYDNSYVPTGTDVHVARVHAEQNLFENIGAEGDAWLVLLTHDLKDVVITRNTFLHAASVGTARGAAVMLDYGNRAAQRLVITNNIIGAGAYEVFYSGGLVGSAALTAMAGASWTFSGNALVGGQYASKYPAGNLFPSTVPVGSTTVGADVAEITRRTAGVVVVP